MKKQKKENNKTVKEYLNVTYMNNETKKDYNKYMN